MSNARKKAKKEKKAKLRKEKAKAFGAKKSAEGKVQGEQEKSEPSLGRPGVVDDLKRGGSKPAGRAASKVHRTQGK